MDRETHLVVPRFVLLNFIPRTGDNLRVLQRHIERQPGKRGEPEKKCLVDITSCNGLHTLFYNGIIYNVICIYEICISCMMMGTTLRILWSLTFGPKACQESILDLRVESACPLDHPGFRVHSL